VSKADQPTNPDAAAAEARRSSAVSFLDIVGYSTLMAENAARTHLDWMKVLNEIVRPAATQYGGRIVKSTGDGVLAEFPDAPAAVAWATAVQNSMLAEYAAAGASRTTIVLRIAVHVDRVFVGGDDIYGPGVNIAARLQEYSEPGGIVLSDAVFDLVKDALDRPVRELGLLRLKNIPSPVKHTRLTRWDRFRRCRSSDTRDCCHRSRFCLCRTATAIPARTISPKASSRTSPFRWQACMSCW
jgi:adenylate cyclase